MRFLLFGTGEYYNRYKIWFGKKDIIALVDNSEEKQGHIIDDILVISPKDISQYEYDAIVILSFYVRSMKEQLQGLGVEEKKIYHFFDLHKLNRHLSGKREIQCYRLPISGENTSADRILLLSHDLTLGGPALALYHAAQILRKRGYQPVYGSMLDGPLRKILMRENIPVIVDENLMIETMKEAQWVKEYDVIICNTMNFHVFLSERDVRRPVVWWLHDALFFYDGVRQEVMDKIIPDNMKVWSVGPIPKRAVEAFRPDFQVKDLLYGVTDKEDLCKEMKSDGFRAVEGISDKIRFTTIGYIEYRKGQDILVEAVKSLNPNIRQKAEFYFVGQNTSRMAQEVMEETKDIPEVIVTGPVSREVIDRILSKSDILVCPSREDPMPTVAAEAMMHGVPCLLSDAAGTAKYISDRKDGFVFQSENVKQLGELLEQCIQGSVDLVQIGKNARKVFEKYFSMETFEKCFMNLLDVADV